jgi:hypothetical protein
MNTRKPWAARDQKDGKQWRQLAHVRTLLQDVGSRKMTGPARQPGAGFASRRDAQSADCARTGLPERGPLANLDGRLIPPTKRKRLPLSRVYRLLEPGPVVVLTPSRKGRVNIICMLWHTMIDFSPPIVGCVVQQPQLHLRGLEEVA